MRAWEAQRIAELGGCELRRGGAATGGPDRVTIDSREAGPGALFVGLPGGRAHGSDFAAGALSAGCWGVVVDPAHADAASATPGGAVLVTPDPLSALQALARCWRAHLRETAGLQVVGVTGSTGKTSTKELLVALLSPHRRTHASRANFNTEIGLPLELLRTPADAELLVLEMGMRGAGQIAELVRIAEPDVGLIVSVGPVHLEQLGTLERIAAAKAELIAGLEPGATAIVPANEPLLEPHLRDDLRTVTFGSGGQVTLAAEHGARVEIDAAGTPVSLLVDFTQAHLRRNLLAAVAAALAVGVTPSGEVRLALSPGRGQRLELPGDVTLLDDSYNANPMSMRAALDALHAAAHRDRPRRAVAVLGDMLELGPEAASYHRQIGVYAADRADVLVAVGQLSEALAGEFPHESRQVADAAAAATVLDALLRPGDVVLVKASNGVGLGAICEALRGRTGAGAGG